MRVVHACTHRARHRVPVQLEHRSPDYHIACRRILKRQIEVDERRLREPAARRHVDTERGCGGDCSVR
jgi:hypothetical protein